MREQPVPDPIYRGQGEINMDHSGIHSHRHLSFRITNDGREDEMEDNMQQVGSVLGNLKNMAADMGQEIDRQNKQLDTVGAKVQHIFSFSHVVKDYFISYFNVSFQATNADVKIGYANKRTENLLK